MRVLVCGGRKFSDEDLLRTELDKLHAEQAIHVLIEGEARGADRLAAAWARDRGIVVLAFKPDWKKYGRAAGPIRNSQMLHIGRPHLVVAFPGGVGTADMKAKARMLEIRVIEIRAPESGHKKRPRPDGRGRGQSRNVEESPASAAGNGVKTPSSIDKSKPDTARGARRQLRLGLGNGGRHNGVPTGAGS